VIDQKAAAGELVLVSPPTREVDVDSYGPRETESVERGKCSDSVLRLMSCRQVEADARDLGAAVGDHGIRFAEAHDVNVVAGNRKVGRDDCRAARWKGIDELPFCAPHPVQRVDQLEMDGTDVGDDADVRARNLTQSCDLSEAAHRELEDADFGVALET